jgi:hypothetical protein
MDLIFPLDCDLHHRVPPPSARWSSNGGCARSPAGTAAIAGANSRTLNPQTTRDTRPLQACAETILYSPLFSVHTQRVLYFDGVRVEFAYTHTIQQQSSAWGCRTVHGPRANPKTIVTSDFAPRTTDGWLQFYNLPHASMGINITRAPTHTMQYNRETTEPQKNQEPKGFYHAARNI